MLPAGGKEAWQVAQIIGGGATPFRVWEALQALLQGQDIEPRLVRDVLSRTQPEAVPAGSLAEPAAPAAGSTGAAAAAATAAVRQQSTEYGTEAVSMYCSADAPLNDSQKQAVLVAAGPLATAQRRIHLIQVRCLP